MDEQREKKWSCSHTDMWITASSYTTSLRRHEVVKVATNDGIERAEEIVEMIHRIHGYAFRAVLSPRVWWDFSTQLRMSHCARLTGTTLTSSMV